MTGLVPCSRRLLAVNGMAFQIPQKFGFQGSSKYHLMSSENSPFLDKRATSLHLRNLATGASDGADQNNRKRPKTSEKVAGSASKILIQNLFGDQNEPSGPIVNTVCVTDATLYLLDQNGQSLGPQTKASANAHAWDLNLSLVKLDEKEKSAMQQNEIVDMMEADELPVFQLVTSKQLQERRKNMQIERKQEKAKLRLAEPKQIRLKDNINDRDLSIKLKSVSQWLEKGFGIRVQIKSEIENPNNIAFNRIYQEVCSVVGDKGRMDTLTPNKLGKGANFLVQPITAVSKSGSTKKPDSSDSPQPQKNETSGPNVDKH